MWNVFLQGIWDSLFHFFFLVCFYLPNPLLNLLLFLSWPHHRLFLPLFFTALSFLPPLLSSSQLHSAFLPDSIRAPPAVTESQNLPKLQPPSKLNISAHTQSPSLVAPHSSHTPAKCNVTAPPRLSFAHITEQISSSKAPVRGLIDSTPAFCLCMHVSVLFLHVHTTLLHLSVSCMCVFVLGAGLSWNNRASSVSSDL